MKPLDSSFSRFVTRQTTTDRQTRNIMTIAKRCNGCIATVSYNQTSSMTKLSNMRWYNSCHKNCYYKLHIACRLYRLNTFNYVIKHYTTFHNIRPIHVSSSLSYVNAALCQLIPVLCAGALWKSGSATGKLCHDNALASYAWETATSRSDCRILLPTNAVSSPELSFHAFM